MVRASLVVAFAVWLGGAAQASPPPEPPPPPLAITRCGSARPWAQVLPCLEAVARQAQAPASLEVVAAGEHVRAVRATTNADSTPTIYILFERDGAGWMIVGLLDRTSRVESIAPFAVGGQQGARVVRGEQSAIHIDGSIRTGWMMKRIESFCVGNEYGYCTDAVTSCDVLVRGAARDTFRGFTKLSAGVIEIVGDRALAGSCAPPERISLR